MLAACYVGAYQGFHGHAYLHAYLGSYSRPTQRKVQTEDSDITEKVQIDELHLCQRMHVTSFRVQSQWSVAIHCWHTCIEVATPQYTLQLSQSADAPWTTIKPLCLTSVLGTCDSAELCSCILEQWWMIVEHLSRSIWTPVVIGPPVQILR